MAVAGGTSEPGAGQAGAAWLHVVRAMERAAREKSLAERHERLAAETGREIHTTMARTHRGVEERHRAAARLQEAYARRLTDWLAHRGARPLFMAGVAEACGTRSAALTLVGPDLRQLSIAASDQFSRTAQDLEYVLGVGPATDATRGRRPVSASGPAVDELWPGYGAGLAALGMGSVVAVPLSTAAGCIGALTVFDPQPGLAESGVLTGVADALADGVLLGPDAEPGLYGGTDLRVVVHQAAGMLSEQLHCPVDDATAIIRAHAFATGESPEAVAGQIVSGDLKLN
ncbi:GAF and ANTAR domain-containing protein [Streptomyces sp. NBC_01465]|uniref:GAF and ANTAR domain-containing protein n=1 Tax=Streptomyces sp. NBC_01465 TaxID=2903878 RepID=UPI002E2EE3D6|nr:GAF and ANTAR domain-containing protein [Streptomyces sp. NBC_01465]